MGNVKIILEKRMSKKAEPGTPASPAQVTVVDLPGFHRREKERSDDGIVARREYTTALKELRKLSVAVKSMKGQKKKDMQNVIKAKKQFMEDMLSKIGTYSDDERMYGFKEVGDGF